VKRRVAEPLVTDLTPDGNKPVRVVLANTRRDQPDRRGAAFRWRVQQTFAAHMVSFDRIAGWPRLPSALPAIKRAASIDVARFRGVAVMAHGVRCVQFSVRDTLFSSHARCNAPPIGLFHQRNAPPEITFVAFVIFCKKTLLSSFAQSRSTLRAGWRFLR
jgi:hypothetical protein